MENLSKIGTFIIKVIGLIILAMGVGLTALSQDVVFQGTTKSTVQVGEQFRVTYTVNSQASGFRGPSFEGFRVLSGPNQSTNQSYQIINGKVTQSVEVSFTYILQSVKEGSFEIPAATVTVDKKQYQSNPLKISVTKTQAPASPQANSQGSAEESGTISKDDVFIKAFVDKSNPYQGEQVIITYRIYTKVPISQLNISKLPSFQGFWYKNLLDESAPLKQSSEVIGGQEYITADLRKVALYPQRSGEITLEPLDMTCNAQVKVQSQRSRDPFFDSFFNDPFFNRNVRNIELNLSSNALKLNVKPLPIDSKPIDFSGAVGSFSLKTDIDRTKLKANEPLVFKVTITGKGNLELIDQLDVNFPPDFESYDPKITNNINTSSTGISGSRTFEYLAIPRNEGDFTIKPLQFTYFDLVKKDYVTLKSPEYDIQVEKGDQESSGISYSGVSQKDIQFIGSDIRHIRTQNFPLIMINSHFFGSTYFFLWLFIPLILCFSFIFLYNMNRKRMGDIELIKNRQANKVARKNLKKASEYMMAEDTEAFYIEISRALWGYISNKFNIPLSELSIETVSQRLEKKKVGAENIKAFTGVLDNCEYARFAPGDKSKKMKEIYDEALVTISNIENELK